MENKKVVKAKFKANVLSISLITIGITLIFTALLCIKGDYDSHINRHYFTHKNYPFFEFLFDTISDPLIDSVDINLLFCFFHFSVITTLLGLLSHWIMNNCALEITEHRVTGRASFGKAVDLPISKISAVGLGMFDSLTISTSSGRISFWLIENKAEIHKRLIDLIEQFQSDSIPEKTVSSSVNTTSASPADELIKYKDLLENGFITQEEFNAKKKQLLDL